MLMFYPGSGLGEALRKTPGAREAPQHQKPAPERFIPSHQHGAVKSQGKKLPLCRNQAAGRTYMKFSTGKQRVVKLKAKLFERSTSPTENWHKNTKEKACGILTIAVWMQEWVLYLRQTATLGRAASSGKHMGTHIPAGLELSWASGTSFDSHSHPSADSGSESRVRCWRRLAHLRWHAAPKSLKFAVPESLKFAVPSHRWLRLNILGETALDISVQLRKLLS